MIVAEHKKWADFIFQHYLNWLFKRHFYAIHLLEPVPHFDLQKPVLLLPNHSTWWDGFFVYLLNKKIIHRKVYLMMLEQQLSRNNFFRFLGAYSIQLDTRENVKQSLQYTIDLLNNQLEPSLICFFPQGELQPWHTRPIVFKRGLHFILNNVKAEIELCFLGIRIEFLGEQRPEVFMQFLSIKELNENNHFSLSDMTSEFTFALDQMEKRIVSGEKGQLLFQGKKSVNEQMQTYFSRR